MASKQFHPPLTRSKRSLSVSDLSAFAYAPASDQTHPDKIQTKKERKIPKTCAVDSKNKYYLQCFRGLQEMRKERNAPVDLYGCHILGDKKADIKTWRFQTLVSCLLSSQTKDAATAACMNRLQQFGLNCPRIKETQANDIEDLLNGCSFHKTKAKHMKQIATILCDTYNSDIPENFEGLMSLPGIGPKMAHLILAHAWDRVEGIAVDTHVHRISNRLGWVKTKDPEGTRKALEQIIPRNHWKQINPMLVGFGQQTCVAVRPHCTSCVLSDLCPASQIKCRQKEKI